MLLINTYFPTDPKTDFDEDELLLMLSEIEYILENNEFEDVVWTGDISADFSRKTKHVQIIVNFLTKWCVQMSWNSYPVEFTHVTEREGSTYTSINDHFIWNEGFHHHVKDAGVLHVPENMSDHSPVYCKICLPKLKKTEVCVVGKRRMIPSWKKATDSEKLAFTSEL